MIRHKSALMREESFMRTLNLLVLSSLLLAGASAWAQPQPIYRPGPPPMPMPGMPMMPNPAQERFCASRHQILVQQRQQGDAYRGEMNNIDTELAQLQRRMNDLGARRAELQNLVGNSDQQVQAQQSVIDRDCAGRIHGCGAYDSMVDQLERERGPIEAELKQLHADAEGSRRDVDRLTRQIQPLSQEFQAKSCNNLVAGSTDQGIIDRCSAIFSEWNRGQAEVNQQNNRVMALRNHYEQLLGQMRGLEQRANGYAKFMTQNCPGSRREVVVRGYGDVRGRAEAMQQQLDQIANSVQQLKGARIAIGIQ